MAKDKLTSMWQKGIGGWFGESSRHSLAAKGIKTKTTMSAFDFLSMKGYQPSEDWRKDRVHIESKKPSSVDYAQRNIITYGVDDDGNVFSRLLSTDQVAVPVIQYNDMKPENKFAIKTKLEKMNVYEALSGTGTRLKWTKKIPLSVKNEHRKFWGLKPLKV